MMRSGLMRLATINIAASAAFGSGRRSVCDDKNNWDIAEMVKKFDLKNAGTTAKEHAAMLMDTDVVKKASVDMYKLLDNNLPGHVGYGFVMGYSSGYCVKRLSKIVAFFVGGAFIGLQTLSYYGYINVNYDKLQSTAESAMDLNKDGKVDAKDMELAYGKMEAILGYNMPSGGGFLAGLGLGLRS